MKQFHCEIRKLKTNCYQSQPKENVKNNLNLIESNFFFDKNLKQKPLKFQYYVVRKLSNLIYYLNACYLIHILSYTQNVYIGSEIQNTGKLLSVMTV